MILKHIFQVVAYLFRLHNFCIFCNKSLSVFGISTVLIQKDAYILSTVWRDSIPTWWNIGSGCKIKSTVGLAPLPRQTSKNQSMTSLIWSVFDISMFSLTKRLHLLSTVWRDSITHLPRWLYCPYPEHHQKATFYKPYQWIPRQLYQSCCIYIQEMKRKQT